MKNFKLLEKFILSRFLLSKKIYGLLQQSCKDNHENQEYLFSFLDIFTNHIGAGKFVIEMLESTFKNNFKILKRLHKLTFQKKSEMGLTENISLIKVLFSLSKEIESGQKANLLNLLNKLCFNGTYL